MNPNTCPPALLEAFAREATVEDPNDPSTAFDTPADAPLDEDDEPLPRRSGNRKPDEIDDVARLREEMRRDALQPQEMEDDFTRSRPFTGKTSTSRSMKGDGDVVDKDLDTLEFSKEDVAEARDFLILPVRLIITILVPCKHLN